MQEITETTITYVSKDGKKFKNKKDCEYHERELDKKEYLIAIDNMNLEELNEEIIKFIGEKGKQYTTNLDDALDLERKRDLFYGFGYMLYRYENKWVIGHIDSYDSLKDIVCCDTIPESISRIAILKFHGLI